jgi:hypothetical protein
MPHIRRLVFSTREDRQAEIARFWTVANELGFSREDLLGPGPQWGRRLDDGILVTLGEFQPVVDNFWGNSPMFWMWTRGLWSLRQSEEFRSRIRDSKMLAFWQENGWPDLCRPTDKDGFECD